MKTQRNHRKTTTVRRRRHVKQRVQTRIHHRKRTVSSGRRHKFFKRGGEPSSDGKYYNSKYSSSVRAASLGQINRDIEEKALLKNTDAVQPTEITYPDVDDFVQNIINTNVSHVLSDIGNIQLTVKKLPQKRLDMSDVKDKERQNPVTIKINETVVVKFYVNYDGNTVVIYVNDMMYGYIMIKINGTEYESSNRGIYNPIVSDAIKQDLIKASSAT